MQKKRKFEEILEEKPYAGLNNDALLASIKDDLKSVERSEKRQKTLETKLEELERTLSNVQSALRNRLALYEAVWQRRLSVVFTASKSSLVISFHRPRLSNGR